MPYRACHFEKHEVSVNTLGLLSSCFAQLCPEVEWQPALASSGGCPQDRQRKGMNGDLAPGPSRYQPGAQNLEGSSLDLAL